MRLADFVAPSLGYLALSPMLVVFGAALVGVLVEALLPRSIRRPAQIGIAFVGLVGAFSAVLVNADKPHGTTAAGAVSVDGPTLFLQGTVLLLAGLAFLLFAERRVDVAGDAFAPSGATTPGSAEEREMTERGWTQTEVWPLAMFSVGGMLLFPAANDLLTMFVALEVLSLPLYLLCGLARRRRLLSQEAAMKYFLLGSFSSAFFLFGAALLYGYSGSISLAALHDSLGARTGLDSLLLIGTAFVAVGLLFKVNAVPFHSWTPDVYQGAPTPVTAFMAACTKVAAFGALLRLFYVGLGGFQWDWQPIVWVVTALTMVVGALLAITQTDIKRMLAYSSIAQAGFILTGFLAASRAGLSSTLFYLLAYGVATIGAFAVVSLVRDPAGEATHLSKWAGLGRRSPVVAGAFTVFLLAFAGIPLTSGFTSKFVVFTAAVQGGATPIVVIGVISSAIAAFFYLRVIVLMFFSEPTSDGPSVAAPSLFTAASLSIAVVVTIVLGVAPGPVLDLANSAASFLR